MTQKKYIGLVLPAPISYSETFFRTKINGLTNKGFELIIFCPQKKNIDHDFKYSFQWPLYKNPVIKTLQVIFGLIYLLLKTPHKVFRHLKLSKQAGIPIFKSLSQLYINGNILLAPQLSFLHFGFASMGIGRELMGEVNQCQLSTSFRGYDLVTYPLDRPGVYQLLWKKLDKVHSISDFLFQQAIQLGLPAKTSYRKITPAVNPKHFNFSPLGIGLSEHKLKILSIGRLHWIKGYEYALMAMRILKDHGISFEYTIVGQGKDWERLHFARHQLGLKKEVKFLGKLPHESIPKVFNQHSIYLQPSIQEGFCNAVLEAQASGLLCIASQVGGLVENILDQETGWLVPVRDAQAIAEKIIEVTTLPQDHLKTIVNQAKQRVQSEFSIEKHINKFEDFYTN